MLYCMLYRLAERLNKRAVLLVDAGGEGVELLNLAQSILLTVGGRGSAKDTQPRPFFLPLFTQPRRRGVLGMFGECIADCIPSVQVAVDIHPTS
jgi:hypothetical protein